MSKSKSSVKLFNISSFQRVFVNFTTYDVYIGIMGLWLYSSAEKQRPYFIEIHSKSNFTLT